MTVTVDEGTNFSAALSPDGQMIAFDLQGELGLVPAAGGIGRKIVTLDDEALLPTWSPDGKWLAFQYYRDDAWQIFVIGRDGKNLRQLTTGWSDNRDPVWTPDGMSLIFSSDRTGNFDLWKVSTSDGALEQLTDTPQQEYFASVARDGRLAYVSADREGYHLILRSDGAPRRLVSSTNEIGLPAWSPDGKQLAYLEYRNFWGGHRTATFGSLKRVDADTGRVSLVSAEGEDVFISRPNWIEGGLLYTASGKIRRRQMAGSAQDIPFTAAFTVKRAPPYKRKRQDLLSVAPRRVKGITAPMVSPDGRKIAFSALGDIWLLTIGDARPQRLTDDPAMDLYPNWSPDSSRLAYASDKRGVGTMDIYVRDLKTGRDERITETAMSMTLPVFSPDGASIGMYTSGPRYSDRAPYILDLQTRELKQLDGQMLNMPSVGNWTPDGKNFVYITTTTVSARDRKAFNVVRYVSRDGSPPRLASPTPGKSLGIRKQNRFAIAPNGRSAVYTQDGLLWQIGLAADGTYVGNPKQLANIVADFPSWTADGSAIVFLSLNQFKRLSLPDGKLESIPLDLTWTPSVPVGRKVVRAGRLYDGVSASYRENVDILIEGNVIREVVPRRAGWGGAEIIDASDKTVVPGLFNNHMHNFVDYGETTGRLALAYGLTSLRDPASTPNEGAMHRELWASGRMLGPRLFTTGITEQNRISHTSTAAVLTVAGVDRELQRAAAIDYDLFKVYERMSWPFMKRAIEGAQRIGIPYTSHTAYPPMAFGVDIVDHVNVPLRVGWPGRASLAGETYGDMIQMYKRSGVPLIPTIAAQSFENAAYYLGKAGVNLDNLPQFRLIPVALREPKQMTLTSDLDPNYQPHFQLTEASLKALYDAGIPLPPGTDGNYTLMGIGFITELQFYVNSGIPPVEVLRLATMESAKLNGVDDLLGSVQPGKLADLVIVSGDPLKRIGDLLNIVTVIKNGEAHSAASLRVPLAASTSAAAVKQETKP